MKYLIMLVHVMLACTYLHAQENTITTRLTQDLAQEGFPTWSPDGRFVVFSLIERIDSLGRTGLWKIAPGDKVPYQIFSGMAEHPKCSPDGQLIVFDADSGNAIKTIPLREGTANNILPDSLQIKYGGMPCWSPDGSHIAFIENGTGNLCVWNRYSGEVKKNIQERGYGSNPRVLVKRWE